MFSFIEKLKSILLPPVLILIGVALLYAGGDEARKMKAIADHGKAAVAELDGVRWKEKRLTGSEKNFKIDIHFVDDNKQTIKAQLSVPKDMGQRLRDGTENTLEIRYLPESPTSVVLPGHTDDSTFMYAGGAAALLAGIGLLVWRFKKRKTG